MNFLTVEGLSKIYADKVLFQDVSFTIGAGQKVALVARNGAGKSSLLRILQGIDPPDAGRHEYKTGLRVGFLNQEPELSESYTVLDEVFYSDNPILQAIQQYEKSLLNPDDTEAMATAVQLMDSRGAWDYELKVKQILFRLNITELDQTIGTLSGGQKKRVALAKLLISEPEFMVLDEPTNHLDLEMIEWLEEFLHKSKMTLLMVTHDRYFLENICEEIFELEQGSMVRYRGNYSDYLEKRAMRHETIAAETDKAKSLMRKELEWVRRQPKARTTKAKSRVDAFDKIVDKASVKIQEETVELQVKTERLGSKVVEFHNVGKGFGKEPLFENFNYKFKRQEKVGVIGRNGSGKSTFLNILTGVLKPDTGKVVIGETVKLGYYTQEGMNLKEGQRVIEVIRDIAENIPIEGGSTITAAAFLERFLFPRSMQQNYVSQLSGGEKRRLYLMTVLMANPNFLILDEPTNDLDILTLNVLEEFLMHFKGVAIIVSHDRYFMDKIVEHCFVFGENPEVRDYPGNYSQYRERKLAEDKVTAAAKANAPAAVKQTTAKQLDQKEQREYFNLEKDIPKLEQKQAELVEQMYNPELSQEELVKMNAELEALNNTIEEKTERWMALAEKLEG